MKIKLPADTAIDAELDLCRTGGDFFLQAGTTSAVQDWIAKSPRPGGRRAAAVSVFQGHPWQHRRCDEPGLNRISDGIK